MTENGEQLYGDAVYEDGVEDTDEFDPSENLTGDDLEEPYDVGYSPPDHQPGATRYGTTDLEQAYGESLDQRLAEEEPDLDPDAFSEDLPNPRAGRLVAPDEGAHDADEDEQFAFDIGRGGNAASAEEAAMHVMDEDDLNQQATNEEDLGR
jgi:hypothetical protein